MHALTQFIICNRKKLSVDGVGLQKELHRTGNFVMEKKQTAKRNNKYYKYLYVVWNWKFKDEKLWKCQLYKHILTCADLSRSL